MDRRSFLKRAGLLSGLAVLNPLKLLGLFKPEPADVINLGQVWGPSPTESLYDDYMYFMTQDTNLRLSAPHRNAWIKNISYWNGNRWIPVED